MKLAAYCTAVLFALTAVAIVAALVAGLWSGVVQIDGTELTIRWSEKVDEAIAWGDGGVYDFYVTGPILGFGVVAALPLVILAIIFAVLFGRSFDRKST